MTIGAIADRLALESSTITTRRCSVWNRRAWWNGRRNTVDERQVHVLLTVAGRALFARSSCLGETLMGRSGMTPQQFDALNQQVRELREGRSAEINSPESMKRLNLLSPSSGVLNAHSGTERVADVSAASVKFSPQVQGPACYLRRPSPSELRK